MVGDVLVERPDPPSVFDLVREPLARDVDVLVGNCETPLCADPVPALTAVVPFFPDPTNARALDIFDVMSLANNHSLDAGHSGLLETIERLDAVGVRAVGAGADIEAARRPVVVEQRGIRVATQAYASVFPMGFEARRERPGLAPMRADNHYRSGTPGYWYPGMPPEVSTVPLEDDLHALEADLARARELADVVIVSFHWGLFGHPHVVTDHEVRIARFCIDHGADAVAGHHHHTLRGIELYRGRPIYYGLGHFAFDMSNECWIDSASKSFAGNYGLSVQEGWPLLQMHPDARASALGFVSVDGGVLTPGLVTCALRPDGRVAAVDPRSDEGRRAVELVEASCASAGLATHLRVDPDLTLLGVPTVAIEADQQT